MKNGDYLLIIAPPEYPGKRYRGRYCYEHHYVYWKHTGLIPNKKQMVHHKNENRYDNQFKNLELIYKKDHPQRHPPKKKESNFHICSGCGIKFYRKKCNRYKKNNIFFHSRECYIKNHYLSPGGRFKEGLFWCNKCGTYLPKTSFSKNSNKSYGISSYCKECRKKFKC